MNDETKAMRSMFKECPVCKSPAGRHCRTRAGRLARFEHVVPKDHPSAVDDSAQPKTLISPA